MVPLTETPRPEELVVEIYRQKLKFQSLGMTPRKVVLSSHHLKAIRLWHAELGLMQNSAFEYITEETIHGLEICLDNAQVQPRVL